MPKKIAIFGGSFNPPGIHHRKVIKRIIDFFDEIIVVPCGPRPEKQTTNDVEPIHRAVMCDMTFRDLPKVRVELFDLEQATFTRTHLLEERFKERGELWHLIGTDIIQRGDDGLTFIHRDWENGPEIWEKLRFAIVKRSGFEYGAKGLPPQNEVFDLEGSGSSSAIRERMFKHQLIDDLVVPEVAEYIKRYGLYQGRFPSKRALVSLESPKLLIVKDEYNPKAEELSRRFERFVDEQNPNMIAVIGGDGTMLRAIRENWRKRLPFVGINTGHRGFLMNSRNEIPENFFLRDWIIQQAPLLYVETLGKDGKWKSSLAFNDAWVERAEGFPVCVEVKINNKVRIPRLEGDGILLATSAGSTAYAEKMGAIPFHNYSNLVLVGSHANWGSANLSIDDEAEFKSLETERRPMRAFADGVLLGEALSMKARTSRIAAVELVFSPNNDIAEKLLQIQFPDGR